MSLPHIPNLTPTVSVTRDDAINLIVSSVAMEEMGLSHIINAEGEKIQFALGTLPGVPNPEATLDQINTISDNVRSTLKQITKLNHTLSNKLEVTTNLSSMIGPTGPTGPTGEPASERLNVIPFSSGIIFSELFANTQTQYALVINSFDVTTTNAPIIEPLTPTLDLDDISNPQLIFSKMFSYNVSSNGVITSFSGIGAYTPNESMGSSDQVEYKVVLYRVPVGSMVAEVIIDTESTFNPPLTYASIYDWNCSFTTDNLNIPVYAGDYLMAFIYPIPNFNTPTSPIRQNYAITLKLNVFIREQL